MKSLYKGTPAPCLDCQKRFIGCHPQCEAYKKYTAERERDRADRQRIREISEMSYYLSVRRHGGKER